MDRVRRSISATLAEISRTQKALGLPVDADEFCEAWGVICRLEQRLANNISGDRKWSPRKREASHA